MTFYWTKISDAGTSNPIIARIANGFSEILTLTTFSKEAKQEITDCLFRISEEMLEAEKAALEILEEIKVIEEKILESNQNDKREISKLISSVMSLNRVRDFLKYSIASFNQLGFMQG
jgi:hypothetical protein